MCRSPSTGGTGLTQPGESLAGAGWWGITGQRAGAVTDAPGASSAVWPRPLRRSPPEKLQAMGKWRDNIQRGGSGTSQSERTTGNPGGSHLPLPGTTTGKESWAGADVTADSLAAGRAGMKLLDNRSLSESKMGDDGDRLIKRREAAVNQGWRIVIPASGPGTNPRRRNVEYR